MLHVCLGRAQVKQNALRNELFIYQRNGEESCNWVFLIPLENVQAVENRYVQFYIQKLLPAPANREAEIYAFHIVFFSLDEWIVVRFERTTTTELH